MYHHQEFLIELVNKNGFQRVVEVGVDGGATSELILKHCPSVAEYYMVDPWVPYSTGTCGCFLERTPEDWEETYQQACERVEVFPAARVMRMSSLEAAKRVEARPLDLDLVFIDGDHSYEAVLADIAAWWPLVRKGGILSGHDYGAFGVKAAVDEYFPNGEAIVVGSTWVVYVEEADGARMA